MSCEQLLVQKVYLNFANESGLNMNQIGRVFNEALKSLQKLEFMTKKKQTVKVEEPQLKLQRGNSINEI